MRNGYDSTQNQYNQNGNFLQSSINASDSVLNYENFKKSMINGSQNCDDKSALDYHTAFQSMAEI